jgi:hypothetical protein
MSDTDTPSPAKKASPCCQLRHKGMYVYTDSSADDTQHSDYDSTIYWCLKSMTSFGPDDDLVDRESCSNPERTCYVPL